MQTIQRSTVCGVLILCFMAVIIGQEPGYLPWSILNFCHLQAIIALSTLLAAGWLIGMPYFPRIKNASPILGGIFLTLACLSSQTHHPFWPFETRWVYTIVSHTTIGIDVTLALALLGGCFFLLPYSNRKVWAAIIQSSLTLVLLSMAILVLRYFFSSSEYTQFNLSLFSAVNMVLITLGVVSGACFHWTSEYAKLAAACLFAVSVPVAIGILINLPSANHVFQSLGSQTLLLGIVVTAAIYFIISQLRPLRRQLLQAGQSAEKQRLAWQENQSCLQSLIDYMSDTVILFDAKSRIMAINKKGEQLLGYQAYELVKQSIHKLLAPKTNEAVSHWQKLAMTGAVVIHGLCKSGQALTLELSIIRNPRQSGMRIAILRNIAEQQSLEMALQGSEKRFHAVFDDAVIGMALVGLDGVWLKVNRALCMMMGYSEAELLRTNLSSVTYPPDIALHTQQQTGLLNGEIPSYEVEQRFYHQEGYLIWVLLRQSVIRDAFGIPTHFVVQMQDINRQKNAESRLIYQSKHDTLTGLLNRQQLEHELPQVLTSARQHQKMVALLCIDLDHFRKVNERFGNDVGDLVLQHIAQCLKSNVEEHDLVGRVGGDKFVVVFANIQTVANVILPLEKIISAVQKPVYIKNYKLFNTISVGISFFPTDGIDSRQLMHNANMALHQAKKTGSDRFRFYSTELLTVV